MELLAGLVCPQGSRGEERREEERAKQGKGDGMSRRMANKEVEEEEERKKKKRSNRCRGTEYVMRTRRGRRGGTRNEGKGIKWMRWKGG